MKHTIRRKQMSMVEIEELIRNNQLSDLDLSDICMYQRLSEKFMDKYSHCLNWVYITIYQDISVEFIIKHIDKIKWNWIEDNPYIDHAELNKREVYLLKQMVS